MIVVIADDLSGAAELAGTAASLGLTAEVHTVFDPGSDADVVAVDTDTRSATAAQARAIVSDIARAIVAARPEWIYKKTDSVLRGNVRDEIEAILAVTARLHAILVPANPSKGRIICGGIYYVDGLPLAETAFAHDPEHPRRSSNARELLAISAAVEDLVIPDVMNAPEVAAHAAKLDAFTLPAGGVEFFEAILRTRRTRSADRPADTSPIRFATGSRKLFVCGSATAWDLGRAAQFIAHGIPILAMPESIFMGRSDQTALENWRASIVAALRDQATAMMAIARPSAEVSALPARELLGQLVEVAASVLASQPVRHLCIEGGATASALLDRFHRTRLKVVPAQITGVAALQWPGGPLLLTKPGSYTWPEAVLALETSS